MSGLSSTGFEKARIADIKADLIDDVQEAFGEAFLTGDETPMGKLIGIFGERESLIWEALEGIYDGQYVDTAGGVSQDKAYALTGHKRQSSAPSEVTLYLMGSAGTPIPKDSIVSVEQAGDFFKTLAAVTLGSIGSVNISSISRSSNTATVTTSSAHGFSTGGYVFIRGCDQTDYNILTPITVTDTDEFTYPVANTPVTPATGTSMKVWEATPVECESSEHGEIQALAGTLTVIETPITGWDEAENYADADEGRLDETDAEFRARRETTLNLLSAGTVDAIKAALLNVDGVTAASVYENPTGSIDSDGRPPYCIECLVTGGSAEDIAECIFENKAAGVRTYGTETPVTHTDSQGVDYSIYYSRLTEVPIYIDLTITTNSDANEGPVWSIASGETNIINNIIDYFADLSAGQDIVVIPYLLAAIAAEPGIASITVYADDSAAPTTSTTISIGPAEIATIDSANITGTIDGGAI